MVPLPKQVEKDTLVWHYTSAEGLLGIVENNSIWASSPTVLNDLSEIQYGVNIFREVWRDLRETDIPKPCVKYVDEVMDFDFEAELEATCFIASASSEGDLLNQWAHYAGRGGFAVGIDTAVELVCRGKEGSYARFSGNRTVYEGWFNVVYDRNEQCKLARELLLFIASTTPGNEKTWQDKLGEWPRFVSGSRWFIQASVAHMKDSVFSAECEIRYISALPRGDSALFRSASGNIVPYCSLEDAGMSAGGSLIKEIRLGPGSDERDRKVIERLLDSRGLKSIGISMSSIPYLAKRN